MKYNRARLEGRNWTKIVCDNKRRVEFGGMEPNEDRRRRVDEALSWLPEDQWMVKHGSGYSCVMLAEEADYIWLKLKLNITSHEYRGCGDWFNHKYSNGPGNRIRRKD